MNISDKTIQKIKVSKNNKTEFFKLHYNRSNDIKFNDNKFNTSYSEITYSHDNVNFN